MISNAEERIPKLEEEKKAAVAKKNFKDAAKFSAETKALETDKSEAETSIVDLEKDAAAARETQSQMEEVVAELESELAVKEAEARTLQGKHLSITIDMLNQAMEAAAAGENYDEAAELQNEIQIAEELKKTIESSLET